MTHNHWVEQYVSAGGLNVHDVQGPEAAHKFNVHLASLRVRHAGSNQTQDSMLRFVCDYTLFDELKHLLNSERDLVPTQRKAKKPGLYMTIDFETNFAGPGDITDNFLHADIRLQEFEVACLLCQKLQLPQTDEGFLKLRSLRVVFGRQFVRRDGRQFFASNERRDMLFLGGAVGGNALCGESICFLSIDNVKSISPDYSEDTHTYALIRWLKPHPDSWERDDLRRPVCPGPLIVNNCLWEYATTTAPRRAMVSSRNRHRPSSSFRRHKRLFGATAEEQESRRKQDQNAFYTLIETDAIQDTMNMCPVFQSNTSILDYRTWLQTVTLE